jgi:3-oxoacyl-[acyl-carrier-protein] synthase I
MTDVAIVATGARTPLGLRSASSASAYRAAISAMGDHPFMIDRTGHPMLAALDRTLDARVIGPERLAALASTALREACAPLRADAARGLRVALYLGIPEIRPGFSAADAEGVRARLAALPDVADLVSDIQLHADGHAAGLSALAAAAADIGRGASEACLVGGVDSYLHPDTMEWLDANWQLAGSEARSAFVPGEGAGVCLLMHERLRARFGLPALAHLAACGQSRETKVIKTAAVCVGEGLTTAVRQVTTVLDTGARRVNGVICDINGERYRGEEWGFVCLRLSQYFDDPSAYWSPADCWGDVGAASGPLFAMLACQAAARGYDRGPRTLLWASSENGLRATAIVESATVSDRSHHV